LNTQKALTGEQVTKPAEAQPTEPIDKLVAEIKAKQAPTSVSVSSEQQALASGQPNIDHGVGDRLRQQLSDAVGKENGEIPFSGFLTPASSS